MQAVVFDTRLNMQHDFGLAPQNFISFNPQGRLVVLAGFGNMSGRITVFDRSTLKKVATIEAPNTTFFEWSPCGRFMLTATLSPRLRVDNGIKVWHCTGPLVHVHLVEELYQASWRPIPVDGVSAFPPQIPPAPQPSSSVALHTSGAKPTPTKPVGAYRPPGARGTDASLVYQRGDSEPNSGANTPSRGYDRSPVPGANGIRGASRGRGRYVPGAPPPSSPSAKEGQDKRVRTKRKTGGKKGVQQRQDEQQGSGNGSVSPVVEDVAKGLEKVTVTELEAAAAAIVAGEGATVQLSGANGAEVEAIQRKMRNLRKKVLVASLFRVFFLL
jgi:translation initiation factor 2A